MLKKLLSLMLCLMMLLTALPAVHAENAVSDGMILLPGGTFLMGSPETERIRMTSWWRRIHVASSGWCFLLTGFHVGMHMQGMIGRLQKKMKKASWLVRIIQVLIAGTAAYCFTLSDSLAPHHTGPEAASADVYQ